jgi:hypothetical protein
MTTKAHGTVCVALGGMKGCGVSTRGLFHTYCTSLLIYVLYSLFMRNLLKLAEKEVAQQMSQLENHKWWQNYAYLQLLITCWN